MQTRRQARSPEYPKRLLKQPTSGLCSSFTARTAKPRSGRSIFGFPRSRPTRRLGSSYAPQASTGEAGRHLPDKAHQCLYRAKLPRAPTTRRRNPDALGSGRPWPQELEGRRPWCLQGDGGCSGFESMRGRGASSEGECGEGLWPCWLRIPSCSAIVWIRSVYT
jgi:hypothetical protein